MHHRSIQAATAAAFLAVISLVASSAHAEKFPYRNIELDKPPPLEAPDPGDVTLQQTPARRSAPPAASSTAAERKGWDGVVKGRGGAERTGYGGVNPGRLIVNQGASAEKVVEPVGGGGCAGARWGGGSKLGCLDTVLQPAAQDKGINEAGLCVTCGVTTKK
jgi:hypothetical protein